MPLEIPTKDGRRRDLVALGEVMLRFDPGETRVHTARAFRVWEGGGQYNVPRGLTRCFGLDTALVSALADNPAGRLVQDLIGNEEDFSAALGFAVGGASNQYAELDLEQFKAMIRQVVREFPNLRLVTTTLRHAKTATVNDWSAICWADGEFFESMPRPNLETFGAFFAAGASAVGVGGDLCGLDAIRSRRRETVVAAARSASA